MGVVPTSIPLLKTDSVPLPTGVLDGKIPAICVGVT